jgi:type VI secretion system protein ImpD
MPGSLMARTDSILDVDKYVPEAGMLSHAAIEDIDISKSGSALHLQIDRLIEAIDAALSAQVNAILHHHRFQRMEAGWRLLHKLVTQPKYGGTSLVRIMSVSWQTLVRDIERAADFDQSKLFNYIYSEEFDMPGGRPFGLLIGDYEVSSGINPDTGTDDVAALEGIASVAAAAFTPFICSASPALLDVKKFAELDREIDMSYLKQLEGNAKWARLRRAPDARFIGITCPRVLARAPHRANDIHRHDGFCFRETVSPDGSTLVWGSAAYAMAMVVLREFQTSGWFADIRGVRRLDEAGGLVDMFDSIAFKTDAHGFASQPPVEIRLAPMQEQMLSHFGLIPLMPLPYSIDLVFNTNQSLHLPELYGSEIANHNARISAMLQYVLCASRFAHYLKLIMREHVGQVSNVDSLRKMLNEWLGQYCIGNDDAGSEMKAKFPLRSANVDVKEIIGRPGVFSCIMQLQPHFQLDDVKASFQLLADMNDKNSAARGTDGNAGT